MKSTVLLLAMIGVLQSMSCEGGGPSAYGYDASSVCNKPYNSRASRAYLENLPCDFRHQNWCTVAGSHYPWHAVRRFVQENQGLMRRMYGIDRQIDILRAEFEKNDVDLEYDDRYERYLDESRRYRDNFGPEFAYYDEDEFLRKRYSSSSNSRTAKLTKRFRDGGKPYYRKSKMQEIPTVSSTTVEDTLTKVSSTSASNSKESDEKLEEDLTTLTTASTTLPATTETLESTTIQNNLTVEVEVEQTTINYTEKLEKEPSVMINLDEKMDTIHNLSINEISGQIDRLDVDVDELIEIAEEVEENASQKSDSKETTSSSADDNVSTTKKPLPDVQQFRPRPGYKDKDKEKEKSTENKTTIAKPENTDTQHYHQDMESKNQHRDTVLKLRGINACPVKDEVVAPLWANNTRGEILALINHYPFEQYVHWEKCTHENKQMYCRDGCRCEQQYRLHRLLAFDPNNECRGIFSDWFKFPSCCVCRCYDLPLEFRVTSRSPRNLKRKIKIRSPRY